MNKKLITLSLALAVLFIAGCEYLNSNQEEAKPVVKVYDKYLYESDLVNIVPPNMSSKDSVNFIKGYIKNWIVKNLLVQQANKSQSFETINIEKKIDDYRNSLIIYEFQKNYFKQFQDTVFTKNEILEYYNNHKGEFTLNENYFKANYIYVKKDSPQINDIWRYYKREDSISNNKLIDACKQLDTKYSLDQNWYTLNDIIKIIPKEDFDAVSYFKYKNYYQTSGLDSHFFMIVKEFRPINDTAPIEVVEDKIKKILIHKKRNDKMKTLEEKLYNNAYSSNNIKYY